MEHQKYIYVVFSSTPYKTGKFIRVVTRENYNHAAISLDPSLKILYSFARYYVNTPFYGGFVKETAERYKYKNKVSEIKVCAVPVTEMQFKQAAKILYSMNCEAEKYRYNMISAVCTPIHKKINIQNSYTCIEFVVSLLQNCGVIKKKSDNEFYSFGDLQRRLKEFVVYQGDFSAANSVGTNQRLKKNIAVRTGLTVYANAALVPRFFKSKFR